MRSAIILAFITAFSVSAFGQSAKISTDPFQTAVAKELARRHISPNVYHQSDLVERMIDRYVAKQLGYNENENSILEVEKDTSYNMDVSRNPADENETNIAVSRTNPKLIVAGANQGNNVHAVDACVCQHGCRLLVEDLSATDRARCRL